MTMGIYSITNKLNGRVYVGQSDNADGRGNAHIFKLGKQYHENSLLQEDFNKYGERAFEFEFLKECKEDQLDTFERMYIKKLNAFEDDGGYNVTDGGKVGFKFSKGYHERLSKSLKGNEKVSKAAKDSWTEERKESKSRELINRYSDPEERKKTSEATKAGMAKLPKEKLSRRHLSNYTVEQLVEFSKYTNLTQKQMVEQLKIPIALAKKLKSGKHWIYEYLQEQEG